MYIIIYIYIHNVTVSSQGCFCFPLLGGGRAGLSAPVDSRQRRGTVSDISIYLCIYIYIHTCIYLCVYNYLFI